MHERRYESAPRGHRSVRLSASVLPSAASANGMTGITLTRAPRAPALTSAKGQRESSDGHARVRADLILVRSVRMLHSLISERENVMSTTSLLLLIVLLFVVFGGGGGYYWSRSRR